MSKNKEIEDAKETEKAEASFTAELLSTDNEGGVVVYTTDAPDGTGFTLNIDDDKIKARAKDGQIWFQAGYNLGSDPFIHLV